MVERVDDMLESFMGIRDTELGNQTSINFFYCVTDTSLARVMVDLTKGKTTVQEFVNEVNKGSLSEFQFPDDFILDVWKVIQKP